MSRGIERERMVRRLLEADGYWTARAAGSKGDADVIALKAGMPPLMVEVKSTTAGPFCDFGPADREELRAAAARAGAEPWLCWWPKRGKPTWYGPEQWPKDRRKVAA
jgi:Holliday junction resolvase